MRFSRAGLLASAVALCAFASASRATITPYGEFTGDRAEGFEHVDPGQNAPIFANTATWAGQLTAPLTISSDTNVPAQITVFPFDGNLMGFNPVGSTTFTFTTPVYALGGFFNSVGRTVAGDPFDTSDVDSIAIFRDSSNNVMDTLHFGIHVANWAWFGWSSDTPIASVEFVSGNFAFPNGPPGESVMFDDMQLSSTPVPEPTALTLLLGVPALAGMARRR